MIQSTDANPTDAFSVAYDVRTGALLTLNWVAPRLALHGGKESSGRESSTNSSAPAEELAGVQAGRQKEILDSARAVAQTRRILQLLEVPEAQGPWRVVLVERCVRANNQGAFWSVGLASARWNVWSYLDSVSGELRAITVLALPQQRRSHPDPKGSSSSRQGAVPNPPPLRNQPPQVGSEGRQR
jgi:hypothetical protein